MAKEYRKITHPAARILAIGIAVVASSCAIQLTFYYIVYVLAESDREAIKSKPGYFIYSILYVIIGLTLSAVICNTINRFVPILGHKTESPPTAVNDSCDASEMDDDGVGRDGSSE